MPKVTHIKSEKTPSGVRMTAYCTPRGGTKFVVRQIVLDRKDARMDQKSRKVSQDVIEYLLNGE